MYYYGIVYFTNGEASISKPFDTLEQCMTAIKEGVKKHPSIIKATSYITRSTKIDVMKLLGCPKTRDVMRDKKFLDTL